MFTERDLAAKCTEVQLPPEVTLVPVLVLATPEGGFVCQHGVGSGM